MSLSSDCTHVLHTYYVAQTPNIPTLHSNAYLYNYPIAGQWYRYSTHLTRTRGQRIPMQQVYALSCVGVMVIPLISSVDFICITSLPSIHMQLFPYLSSALRSVYTYNFFLLSYIYVEYGTMQQVTHVLYDTHLPAMEITHSLLLLCGTYFSLINKQSTLESTKCRVQSACRR